MPARLLLSASILGLVACGGLVVYEEQGTGGATAGTTSSAGLGGDGPCAEVQCGDGCDICEAGACSRGFCDRVGACVAEPTSCAVEMRCYQPAPGAPCAASKSAGPQLCARCSGPKGCVFAGNVHDGPWLTPDGCCYTVVGECLVP